MTNDKQRHQKALALMLCLFLGYMYVETIWKPYFFGRPVVVGQPQVNSSANQQVANSSSAAVSNNVVANNAAPTELTPASHQVEQSGKIRVITKELKIELALLGGRITKAELLKYKKDLRKKTPLNIVEHLDGTAFPLGAVVNGNDDALVQYQIMSPSTLRQGEPGISVLDLKELNEQATIFLKGTYGNGAVVKKKITFRPEGYLVDVEIEVENTTPQSLSAYWSRYVAEDTSSKLDPYKSIGFVWFDGQKALRKTFSETTEPENLGKVQWISSGDKYFTTTIVGNASANISKTDKVYFASISDNPSVLQFQLFIGPKNYELLKSIGHELHREIDFGMFALVSAPLLSLLRFFNTIFRNYGLAIVVLTILVRLALYPLNSASFKQMKAMQDLKPELDKLKETVKDKQQQQVAMMELYKKKGVNPLGGCLPVLLQMPIFIGLYSALSLAVELRHAHFAAWIDDLSAPEKLMIGQSFGIPVMVILFVISMMVQQWTTPTTMDPAQKKVMMIMPAVMGFMFASFPAGLTLYWLTSNLISIGQQKAMHSYDKNGKSPLAITLSVSGAVFLLAFLVSRF